MSDILSPLKMNVPREGRSKRKALSAIPDYNVPGDDDEEQEAQVPVKAEPNTTRGRQCSAKRSRGKAARLVC